VPVLITDGSKTIIIASGNVTKQEMAENKDARILIKKMSKENVPIEIDLGAGEKNYIFYQDSSLLLLIKYFPFIQLGVIGFLILIG